MSITQKTKQIYFLFINKNQNIVLQFDIDICKNRILF